MPWSRPTVVVANPDLKVRKETREIRVNLVLRANPDRRVIKVSKDRRVYKGNKEQLVPKAPQATRVIGEKQVQV